MSIMARRMSHPVVRRPSVPLTASDEDEIRALRLSPDMRRALADIAPAHPALEGDVSEGVLLHALLQAGFSALKSHMASDGYSALAEEYATASAMRRRMSRRRNPEWADEP